MTDEQLLKKLHTAKKRTEQIRQSFVFRFGEENVDVHIPMPLEDDFFLKWYKGKKYLLGLGEKEDLPDPVQEYLGNQPITIMVYWNKVHIVNVNITNHKGHDIYDLYAKVEITPEGKFGGWTMNRSTFTPAEWRSGYIHSHLPKKSSGNLPSFHGPCTGSGPINGPMRALRDKFDIDWWDTFTFELSRYVGVESTEGGPYIRIDNIVNVDSSSQQRILYFNQNYSSRLTEICFRESSFIQEFIRYFLSLKLPVVCTGTSYRLSMSIFQFWLMVSNAFIDWYNVTYHEGTQPCSLATLISRKILIKAVYKDNRYYELDRTGGDDPLRDYSEDTLKRYGWAFKGSKVHFSIIGCSSSDNDQNSFYILNNTLVFRLFSIINAYLTCYYGYKETTRTRTRR